MIVKKESYFVLQYKTILCFLYNLIKKFYICKENKTVKTVYIYPNSGYKEIYFNRTNKLNAL